MKYRTIVADPPWRYTARAEDVTHRGRCPYPTMTQAELLALTVPADDPAHLYLWVTNAFMVDGHQLASAWGFNVKTILTWVKPQIGLGNYFRNNTEHVLFCVRGSLPVQRHDIATAFTANRTRHSEKPDLFYDLVEMMSPGPYVEMFTRRLRLGWDGWGNEWYENESVAL